MDSALDGAGDLATAAAAASVIEPPAGRPQAHGEACPNCSAIVDGAFCSTCGQQAHVHRSLSHALEELLHGVWHFDSKLWNTLPLLVVRPGKLTRDYVFGKRARYISPMGLFLLTIFLMFFVFGLTGGLHPPVGLDLSEAAKEATTTPDGKARLAEIDKSLGEIERDLAKARSDPARKSDVTALELTKSGLLTSRKLLLDAADGKLDSSEGPAWASAVKSVGATGNLNLDLGDETLNQKVRAALKNPEFALYKVQQKGYKLSFLLLPMSLPWMLLMFAWKRQVKAYDHVVFLLYSISFMSMLVVAVVLLAMAGVQSGLVYILLICVAPPLHMFLQMKEAYALSTVSALWRTSALVILSILTLALYFALVVALGLVE